MAEASTAMGMTAKGRMKNVQPTVIMIDGFDRDDDNNDVLGAAPNYVVMGRLFGYFKELETWTPMCCQIVFDQPSLTLRAEVRAVKHAVTTEISAYLGANIEVRLFMGQSPSGDALDDDYRIGIKTWIYVAIKEEEDKSVEPSWPPAGVTAIAAHVYMHDVNEWKTISMPNREGPTRGRMFVTIKELKKEALIAFYGHEDFDSLHKEYYRSIKVYYNDSGKPKLPLSDGHRVVHNKWYSMTCHTEANIKDLKPAPTSPDGESIAYDPLDDCQ